MVAWIMADLLIELGISVLPPLECYDTHLACIWVVPKAVPQGAVMLW